ncbi:MAG: roadblock/LC7 domain-containing protein [Anaerolineae bacterium]|nr:roadblock/LC7 domain-containing protein [Anaerolineae bacterium]
MRADFDLPVDLADLFERVTVNLRRTTDAECVILADISGQLVSVHGGLQEGDPATVAALAAGDLAAMAELSRQVGEENPSGSFLHEGKHKSIYLQNVADNFILIVVFHTDRLIGMVRLFAKHAAEKIQELAVEFEGLVSQPSMPPDTDFGAALADELERTFGEF